MAIFRYQALSISDNNPSLRLDYSLATASQRTQMLVYICCEDVSMDYCMKLKEPVGFAKIENTRFCKALNSFQFLLKFVTLQLRT